MLAELLHVMQNSLQDSNPLDNLPTNIINDSAFLITRVAAGTTASVYRAPLIHVLMKLG